MADSSSPTSPAVTAQYTSPSTSSTHTFSLPLDTPLQSNRPATQDRTAYLAALRQNTKQLQADVNKFLTERMEEDKASAASTFTANVGGAGEKGKGGKGKTNKAQDEIEEENYGEEVVEDD